MDFTKLLPLVQQTAEVVDATSRAVTDASPLQLWAQVATILTGIAATAALLGNWMDRIARDRPYFAFANGRLVADQGKHVVDDRLVTNAGAGPAVRVTLAFWFSQPTSTLAPIPSSFRPIVFERPVITKEESIRYGDELQAAVGMLLYHYLNDYRPIRGDANAPMRSDVTVGLQYEDRAGLTYYQEAQLHVAAEWYVIEDGALANISVLRGRDPDITDVRADGDVSGALSVGLVGGYRAHPSRQFRVAWWFPLRPSIRRALRDIASADPRLADARDNLFEAG